MHTTNVKSGVVLTKQVHGAGHERGLRPGTENTIGIATLGARCAAIADREYLSSSIERMRYLRDTLYTALADLVGSDSLSVNGPPMTMTASSDNSNSSDNSDNISHGKKRPCLSNTLSVSILGTASHAVLARAASGVSLSAGSACHSGSEALSKVLLSMGTPREKARGTLRLSVGMFTSVDGVRFAAECIAQAVRESKE